MLVGFAGCNIHLLLLYLLLLEREAARSLYKILGHVTFSLSTSQSMTRFLTRKKGGGWVCGQAKFLFFFDYFSAPYQKSLAKDGRI